MAYTNEKVYIKDRFTYNLLDPVTSFDSVRDASGNTVDDVMGVVNVTTLLDGTYYGSISSAAYALKTSSPDLVKPGLIMTYAVNSSYDVWEMWQYDSSMLDSSSFMTASNWTKFSSAGSTETLRRELLDGTLIPALARNLYSSTDISQTGQGFIFRTTANGESVRSGVSYIDSIKGNFTQETGTNGSRSIVADPLLRFDASVTDLTKFLEETNERSQSTFEYSDASNGWKYMHSGNIINPVDFGLTITGTARDNDSFIVYVDAPAGGTTTTRIEFIPEAIYYASVTDASAPVFKDFMNTKTGIGQDTSINITYNGAFWGIDSSMINLADIGMTFSVATGATLLNGDKIRVNYTRANYGKIRQSTPTKFVASGLNSFNINDSRMYLDGYGLDASGNVTPLTGSSLCIVHAAWSNSSKYTGYVAYDENSTMTAIGWSNVKPTYDSSVSLGTFNTGKLNYVNPNVTDDYYVVVACTDKSKICIHPKWSGYMNEVYESYLASEVNLPDYQLFAIGYTVLGNGVYLRDELDYVNNRHVKNIGSKPFTEVEWENTAGAKIHDSSTIYYALDSSVVTSLSGFSNVYQANDFGTEEFVGTEVPLIGSFRYGANLVDKLREDVLTDSMTINMSVIYDDGSVGTFKILRG